MLLDALRARLGKPAGQTGAPVAPPTREAAVAAPAPAATQDGFVSKLLDGIRLNITQKWDANTGPFNLQKNIDQLVAPDDFYTESLGANGHVVAGGFGDAGLTVTKGPGNTYRFQAGGDLGAGVWAGLATLLAVSLGLNGDATAGAGLKLEWAAQGLADAKETEAALWKQALAASLPQTRRQGLTLQDLSLSRLSAIEAHGHVAADLFGSLGLNPLFGLLQAEAGSNGDFKGDQALRIELANGTPKALVLISTLAGQVGLNSGIVVPTTTFPIVGGNATGTLTAQSHFDLPQGLHLADLMRDPVGTLGSSRDQVAKSLQQKLSVSLDSGVTGRQPCLVTVDFGGDLGKLLKTGAVGDLLRGKVDQAVAAANGAGLTAQGMARPYGQSGLDFAPTFNLFGVGGQIELLGQRTNYGAPVWSYPS